MVAWVKSPLRTHTCDKEQGARWTEHDFNRPPPTVEADVQEAETDLQKIVAAITGSLTMVKRQAKTV